MRMPRKRFYQYDRIVRFDAEYLETRKVAKRGSSAVLGKRILQPVLRMQARNAKLREIARERCLRDFYAALVEIGGKLFLRAYFCCQDDLFYRPMAFLFCHESIW